MAISKIDFVKICISPARETMPGLKTVKQRSQPDSITSCCSQKGRNYCGRCIEVKPEDEREEIIATDATPQVAKRAPKTSGKESKSG